MLEELMKLTHEELVALFDENMRKYEFSLVSGG